MRRRTFIGLMALEAGFATRGSHAQSQSAVQLVDKPLVNAQGQKLHFVRDLVIKEPIILSFTFTGCLTLCPTVDLTIDLTIREFSALKKPQPRFATLTIDPFNDTPAVLAERAQSMAPERMWLTGEPSDVFAILDGLGFAPGRLEDHELAIFIISGKGKRVRRLNGVVSAQEVVRTYASLV